MATALITPALDGTARHDALLDAINGTDRTVCVLRSAPVEQVRGIIARIKQQAPHGRIHLLCQTKALHAFTDDRRIDGFWEYPDEPPFFMRLALDGRTVDGLHRARVDAVVIPEHNEDGLNYGQVREMALLLADRVVEVTPSGRVRLSYTHRRIDTTPRHYVVAASSRCNLRCIFCASGDRRHEFGSDFDYGSFERILSSLKNPQAVFALLLGGEPFLNPNLLRMVRDVKARNCFASITTNANLIGRAAAESLVACGLDELRISINASDKRLYERVMGRASWESLIEALEALRDARQSAGSAKPSLRFIMVGMKVNIHELPGVTRLAGRYGVETVILNGFMPNPRVVGQSLLDDVPLLGRYYDEAVAVGETLGVKVTLDEADQYKQALLAARQPVVPAPEEPGPHPPAGIREETRLCFDPWLTVHLYETGVVLPCCGGIRQPFGNLADSDLLDIWNGSLFQELRDGILSGRMRPECRECKMRVMGPTNRVLETLRRLEIQAAEVAP